MTDSKIVSPVVGDLSEVIRAMINGNTEKILGRGHKECETLIRAKRIKKGHIICTVRSFNHVKCVDGYAKWCIPLPDDLYKVLAQADLFIRGQQSRDFAYMHFAIYVGKNDNGDIFVAENAGSYNADGDGRVSFCGLKDSFKDIDDDESAFFVIAPNNERRTQQRALATVYDQLKYTYNIAHFNCETYANICAEFYDDNAKGTIIPAHLQRVIMGKDGGNTKKAGSAKEQEKIARFVRDKQRMIDIFTGRQKEIDGSLFKIEGDKVVICLAQP